LKVKGKMKGLIFTSLLLALTLLVAACTPGAPVAVPTSAPPEKIPNPAAAY
jgi:hypothetical protein